MISVTEAGCECDVLRYSDC